MANKHLARSITLQALFERDFRGGLSLEDSFNSLDYIIDKVSYVKDIDIFWPREILKGVIEKQNIIDEIIEKAAPDWTIDKIASVDRNILRLGLFELLFGNKKIVPPKVAINEAIELAKQFGGAKSGKFINGVMGAVYREIGEPGKNDKKKTSKKIDKRKLPIQKKGGAVIYSIDNEGKIRICLVHDVFGYWTLSKGGIKENETLEDGTKRRIKEETNLDISLEDKLGENEYIAHHPEDGHIRKQVQYFLAKTEYVEPKLEEGSGGLDGVDWFELEELGDLTIYDDVLNMIIKAIKLLTE